MNSFEERLIALVKQNDFLFNTKSRCYKNIIKRDFTWAKIAEELQKPIEECKQRWKSLRDRFVREKKKLEQPSGSGACEAELWELYPLLEFLSDAIKPRKQIGNYDTELIFDESSGTHHDVFSPSPEVSPHDSPVSSASIIKSKKRPRSGEFPVNEFFGNLSQAFSQRFSNPEDENDLFMKSMAQKMKLLPQESKIRLQNRILQDINAELMLYE